MIIIGPFIIVVNNYGLAQEQPPESQSSPGRPPLPQIDTQDMVYIKCDKPGCEWDGHYDTQGKAGQALGVHKSWCNKGKLFKKQPFGTTK